MEIRVTESTIAELRETHQLLVENEDKLAEMTKNYPLVVTFAGQRRVCESKIDVRALIDNIQEAIVNFKSAA